MTEIIIGILVIALIVITAEIVIYSSFIKKCNNKYNRDCWIFALITIVVVTLSIFTMILLFVLKTAMII